jgi:hypothetical protein
MRASASAATRTSTHSASQALERSWNCHEGVGIVAFTPRSAAISTAAATETRKSRSATCSRTPMEQLEQCG